mgnify:CR=1 FL=1
MGRLALGRYEGESIQIGDDIRVTVVRIKRCQVKLLIEAPETVRIVRTELIEREQDAIADAAEREEASHE